ncbi:MAG: uroporphyrinogen III synthase [Acidobacteria bacterium]|nr:MAG: uroporphyrinogen III synthase [Acidobacteriota bacterium]
MAGFNGLRVLSFESRRAKEIAHLIANNGGVPIVAPSTREVPEGPNEDEVKLIRGILAQEFDAVIFMTGVGARALIETAKTVSGENFLTALGKTAVVVRGPKPSAVMREFNVPVTLAVPEPNTWREIVSILGANSEAVPLQGRRIAVQEHGEPSPELYAALRERGAEVFPVHVYRWELPEDIGPLKAAVQSLVNREINVVMFTSSVQFAHAGRIADELGVRSEFLSALKNVIVASIGPTTSETLRKNGLAVDFEPSHPKMGFLVREASEKSAELVQAKAQSRVGE